MGDVAQHLQGAVCQRPAERRQSVHDAEYNASATADGEAALGAGSTCGSMNPS
jgi:hypothetical protein